VALRVTPFFPFIGLFTPIALSCPVSSPPSPHTLPPQRQFVSQRCPSGGEHYTKASLTYNSTCQTSICTNTQPNSWFLCIIACTTHARYNHACRMHATSTSHAHRIHIACIGACPLTCAVAAFCRPNESIPITEGHKTSHRLNVAWNPTGHRKTTVHCSGLTGTEPNATKLVAESNRHMSGHVSPPAAACGLGESK